jgi:hypothetical protein
MAAQPRIAVVAAAVMLIGCGAHVDAKGREVLRLGPLRTAVIAPALVDPKPVDIDAGTDALDDAELAAIAARLPQALAEACEKLAFESGAKKIGTARITQCRLRAGKSKKQTVYEARCRVAVAVDGVDVVEVHTEALLVDRPLLRAKDDDTPAAPSSSPRNPLLLADNSEKALQAALQAAAQVIVNRAVDVAVDDRSPGEAKDKRAMAGDTSRADLARARLAAGGDAIAALFDIGENGAPADAGAVLPFLDDDDPKIKAAAADALGLLCSPLAEEKLKPLAESEDALVKASTTKALARIAACRKL